MAVESQFDGWRKNIIANLRKAGEAALSMAEDGESFGPDGEMRYSDRVKIAIASAQVTGQVMIAERLGQIAQGLFHQEEAMSQAQQRARSGEQILSRLLEVIEAEGYDLSEDAETLQAMAEDWLEPDGPVGFSTPEAIEAGADSFTRDGVDSEDVPEERVEDDGEAEPGS